MTRVNRSAPKPAVGVRELEIDGEVTLYHEATATALVLNNTASDVWRLLDGHRSVDEIVALLAHSYSTDHETVRAGVDSALDQLTGHQLLENPGE